MLWSSNWNAKTMADTPVGYLLDFYREAGVDALLGEEPIDRFAADDPPPAARAPQPIAIPATMPADLETKGRAAAPPAPPPALDEAAMAARQAAKSAKSL